MISLDEGIPKLAITTVIVGKFIFVCMNAFDRMDGFKGSVDDIGEEERASNLGKKFLEAPWGMFKSLVFLIFGVIAICQFQNMWDIL